MSSDASGYRQAPPSDQRAWGTAGRWVPGEGAAASVAAAAGGDRL